MSRKDQIAMRQTRLPLLTKLGYGSTEIGQTGAEVFIQLYLFEYYITHLGLSPLLTGLAIGLAVLWDAVTDPLMGQISDQTRSRWGRRRPYILAGSLFMFILYPLLFANIQIQNQFFLFSYLFLTYALVNTSLTIASVPYMAMAPSLTEDRDERTALFGWRFLFANFGLLLGTVGPALFIKSGFSPGESRFPATAIIAGLAVLTAVLTIYVTRNHDRPANRDEEYLKGSTGEVFRWLWIGLRDLWKFKTFRILLISFAIAAVARTFNASIAIYYYKYRLNIPEDDVMLFVLGIFILCLSLSIPFWYVISRRLGKVKPSIFGVTVLGGLTALVYPILPENDLTGPVIMGIIGGFLAGSIILFESLVADVTDYDTLRSGRNREGLFFGVWKLATKVSRAAGLGIAGLALYLVGFEEGTQVQSPIVREWLAWFFGPVVGGLFIISGFYFLKIPWNTNIHKKTISLLRKRSQKQSPPSLEKAETHRIAEPAK